MFLLLMGLTILNGIFALCEMALVSVRKARLQKYIEENDKGAKVAAELSENPGTFLAAIQLGLITCAVVNGAIGEKIFSEPIADYLQHWFGMSEHNAEWIGSASSFAIITYLTVVIGELVPKRLGIMYAETISRYVAIPISIFSRIAHPIIVFLNFSTKVILRLLGVKDIKGPSITEEEIHELLSEGSESGLIDEHEHQMLKNVIRLDDRKIVSMMVPRVDVVWLSVDDTDDKVLEIISTCQFSRFPVCKDRINDVIGVVSAKRVLSHAVRGQKIDLKELMTPVLFVPESVNGLEFLQELKASGDEMAAVVDEYGDVQGIVTIHDLLEAITGEFTNAEAHEDEAWAIQRKNGSWLLDGLIPNQELKDRLEIKNLPDEERGGYNTLSGLIMQQLGRMPATADVVDFDGWRFEIVDMDGKRIDKVLATPINEHETN